MRAALDPALVLDAALAASLAPHLIGGDTRIAVAYSGGADSTALLHAAHRYAAARSITLHAFHIHHGLAGAADDWLAHCRAEATRLGIVFDSEHVTPGTSGGSLEADARRLRYAALDTLCRRHEAGVLMTAHHADDQAETVLLNLARGAGIGGLAATARSRRQDGLAIVRPFIDLAAATLRADVAARGLAFVDDPSNQDRRFTRNAIRHEVMPPLRRIAPTIAARLARTASHAASLQTLLDEIGAEDLHAASAEADLDTERLTALSSARAANALRVWLARRGMRAPSAPALKEMLQQLLHASPDAQIALLHERHTLRLYRGRVSVDHGSAPRAAFLPLSWSGEERIAIPEWHGCLVFRAAKERGIDAAALREGPLAIRPRHGGERLTKHAGGPNRTLKNLYQEAAIPAWCRARLPLVYLGDRLLFAAGLGTNETVARERSSGVDLVAMAWESTAPR